MGTRVDDHTMGCIRILENLHHRRYVPTPNPHDDFVGALLTAHRHGLIAGTQIACTPLIGGRHDAALSLSVVWKELKDDAVLGGNRLSAGLGIHHNLAWGMRFAGVRRYNPLTTAALCDELSGTACGAGGDSTCLGALVVTLGLLPLAWEGACAMTHYSIGAMNGVDIHDIWDGGGMACRHA